MKSVKIKILNIVWDQVRPQVYSQNSSKDLEKAWAQLDGPVYDHIIHQVRLPVNSQLYDDLYHRQVK